MSSENTSVAKVSSNESPPAIAHALGGSIGSALSQLLLYPLERVRIELQASLSSIANQQQNELQLEQKSQSQDSKDEEGKYDQVQQRQNQLNNKESICELTSNKLSEISPYSASKSFVIVSDQSSSETCPAILSSNSSSASSSPSSNQSNDPDSYFDSVKSDAIHQQQCKAGINEFNSSSPSIISKETRGGSLDNTRLQKKSPMYEIWTTIIDLYQRGELYRGAKPIATTIFISNFIFFYAHTVIKLHFNTQNKIIMSQKNKRTNHTTQSSIMKSRIPSVWKSLFASSLAGIINVLLTNPFWVANMRIIQEGKKIDSKSTMDVSSLPNDTIDRSIEKMSLNTSTSSHRSSSTTTSNERNKMKNDKESLILTIKSIIQDEGVGELWNGTFASLLLVSNPAIQHFAYDRLRFHILRYKQTKKQNSFYNNSIKISNNSNLSPLEAFLFGAIAKAIATVVTYPLQLTQTLLRLQKKQKKSMTGNIKKSHDETVDNSEYHDTADCLIKLYKIGGLKALYSGMKVKLIQTVLNSAFTFLTYEQILNIIEKVYYIGIGHS